MILVHGPVHASWLNQIEIYFSIVQRKVLTPNDFGSLADIEDRLLAFQQDHASIAKPFQWRFTRDDLDDLMHRCSTRGRPCGPPHSRIRCRTYEPRHLGLARE